MPATTKPPTPNPHSPRLVAIIGPLKGRQYHIDQRPLLIGRHSTSNIQIHHESVSRRHCQITTTADGSEVRARDLESLCGTFVNGVPIRQRRLEHGDYLKVGESLFLFLTHADEALEPAAPSPDEVSSFDLGSTMEMSVDDSSYLHPAAMSAATSEQTARHLALLLELAVELHTVQSTAAFCTRLTEVTRQVLPTASRVAMQVTEDGGATWTQVRAQVQGKAREEERKETPDVASDPAFSRQLARRTLSERRAVLSNDITELGRVESLDGESLQSVLCIPMVAGEHPLGVLYADAATPTAPFTREHLDVLAAAASMTSMAFENARRAEWLAAENQRFRDAELDHDLIGESPAMGKVLSLVARVAPTDLSVLVQGESGTGKELIAKALHRNSPRADQPFIAINCATLSETLLESELFGHEKGAFTGAVGRRIGQFEAAHHGTLFLDEVGEIPVALQAKLLRALEEREIQRVGGTHPIAIDVRLVAATHRDLAAAITDGSFREDLYHRINVFSMTLPPLRERGDDVVLLAHHFAAQSSRRLHRPLHGLAPEARAAIVAHDWPGNVRELKNAMERAVVLAADEVLRLEDLPEAVVERAVDTLAADGYHAAVAEAKRRILRTALAEADGSYVEAAQRLGLNRTYLHRLVGNLGLRPADE